MKKSELKEREELVKRFNQQFAAGDIIQFKEKNYDNTGSSIELKEYKSYTLAKPGFIGKYCKQPFVVFKESRLLHILTNQAVANFK